MAEKAKLEIDIQATNQRALADVEQGLDKIEKKGKISGAALSGAFVTLGATFAGISAGVMKTVSAFSASEQASTMLAQALKNTGNYSAAAMADLNNYAASLQRTTKFEDDSIIAAQSLIAAQGYHGQVLKDITKATLDLATAKGMDLSTAADIVAKSVGTETDILKRYGIEVSGAADSTDRAYSAIKSISDLYGGHAAAAGRTYEGQMSSLKNEIGNVAEELGAVFAPIVLEITKVLKEGAVIVGNFVTQHKALAAVIIGSVAGFTGLAAAVAGIMAIMPVLVAAFAIMTSPISLMVGGILLLVAAIENWGTVSDWLMQAWNKALSYMSNIWEEFKNYLSERLETMKEMLTLFGEMVWEIFTGKWKEAIDTGKLLTEEFVEANKSAFDALYGSTLNTVGNLAMGTAGLYEGLKNKVTGIINNIQQSWKGGLTKQTADVQSATATQATFWQQYFDKITLAKATQTEKFNALEGSITNAFSQAATLRNAKTRELFEIGKAAAIGQALIAGALAVMQIWGSVFQLGPIAGPIVGGILTGVMAGVTAFNVAQISSQDMPAAEFGGIIPGSASGMPVLAGEKNKSEAIIPLEGEGAARLQSAVGGGNTIVINAENVFADDTSVIKRFARALDEELENLRSQRSSAFGRGIITQVAIG